LRWHLIRFHLNRRRHRLLESFQSEYLQHLRRPYCHLFLLFHLGWRLLIAHCRRRH
jgi:hypothetical protein